MKRFVSLMLTVCCVSLLFGCVTPLARLSASGSDSQSAEATIIEGKTTKAEIIAALGNPKQMGALLPLPGDANSSDQFLYLYQVSYSKAEITLIQKDGTKFPISLGYGRDKKHQMYISFDKKGIVSKVTLF